MFKTSKTLGLAALLTLINSALHMVAPLLSGFSSESTTLAIFGVIGIFIALGLLRGLRWLAWVTFFVMLAGAIASISGALTSLTVPSWYYWAIASLCGATSISLFLNLWMPKPQTV